MKKKKGRGNRVVPALLFLGFKNLPEGQSKGAENRRMSLFSRIGESWFGVPCSPA